MVSRLVRAFSPTAIAADLGRELLGPLELTPEAMVRQMTRRMDLRRQLSRALTAQGLIAPNRRVRIADVTAYSYIREEGAELEERLRAGGLIAESGNRTPPIVVQTEEGMVLLDGSKRLQRALDEGEEEIDVLVFEV